MPRNIPQSGGPKVFGGSSDGNISYVEGDQLKGVSEPVETLLGTANGALGGAILSLAASAGITALQQEAKKGLGKAILSNIAGSHKYAIIGGTVALGALGALVSNARARMHNQWRDRQYDLLNQQSANENGGHASAVDAGRKENDSQGVTR